MLYQARTKTLIHIVPPGEKLPEEQLRELASLPGRQTDDGEDIEKLALVFVGGKDDADAHAGDARRFGLEVRYIARETGQEVVLVSATGFRYVKDSGEDDDSTIIPVLREQSWPHLDTVVHRRLLDGPADCGGPWVTFGWDSPQTLARFSPDHLAASKRTLADLEGLALANLARRSFTPTLIRPGAVGVRGPEYCSESILLPDVMNRCAELLGGCQLMAVAVPKENILVAVDAGSFEDTAFIVGTTREMFDSADGRRISPFPFIVGQGKPIGFVSPRTRTPEPAKKPWYKFW